MNLLIIFLLLIVIGLCLYIKRLKKNSVNTISILLDSLNNFPERMDALRYFMDKAYYIVYQTDIASFVASGYSPNEKENMLLCNKFIDNLYSIMGSNLKMYYITMFGDEETFINNCLIYFNNELIEREFKETITSMVEENE